MNRRLDDNDSKKNLSIWEDRKFGTSYKRWLEEHKEELDRKWYEMHGPNVDTNKEEDRDYVTYVVDKFIEWLINRSGI